MDKGLWQSILNLLLCNSATFLIRVRPYPCPKNLKNHLAGSAIDDLHLEQIAKYTQAHAGDRNRSPDEPD